MSDVLRVLTEARELISDESRWNIDDLARDAFGRGCDPLARNAVSWCGYGALQKCMPPFVCLHVKLYAAPLYKAAAEMFGKDMIADVNNILGHRAMLQVFDAAIATEQAKAGAAS